MLSLGLVNQSSETNFAVSASSSAEAGTTDGDPVWKIKEHVSDEETELRRGRCRGMC